MHYTPSDSSRVCEFSSVCASVCVCLSEHPFAVDLLRWRKEISTRTGFLSVFFDPVPFHFVSFMAG